MQRDTCSPPPLSLAYFVDYFFSSALSFQVTTLPLRARLTTDMLSLAESLLLVITVLHCTKALRAPVMPAGHTRCVHVHLRHLIFPSLRCARICVGFLLSPLDEIAP